MKSTEELREDQIQALKIALRQQPQNFELIKKLTSQLKGEEEIFGFRSKETDIKALFTAIKEGNLKLVNTLITYLAPEDLVAREVSIGEPIKLAVTTGNVEIVRVLLQKNPKLLSLDNVMGREDQMRKLIIEKCHPEQAKFEMLYNNCSDEMLKTVLEFDSVPLAPSIVLNRYQDTLRLIKLNPKVLKVLIEEESPLLDDVLEIIKSAGEQDIISVLEQDGQSLLNFANAKGNIIAVAQLGQLFPELFSSNKDDLKIIDYTKNLILAYRAHLEQQISDIDLNSSEKHEENTDKPLSGENDDSDLGS